MRKYPFLVRFLITYLVILLPPILLAAYSYHRTERLYYQDVQRMNYAAVVQTSRLVEANLNTVDRFIERIAINRELSRFLFLHGRSRTFDYPHIVNMWESLTQQERPSIVATYFVYVHEPHVVLTPTTVYFSPELYHKHYFRGPHSHNTPLWTDRYDQWQTVMLSRSHDRSAVTAVSTAAINDLGPAILYVQSLPLYISPRSPLGTLGVVVDSAEVKQMVRDIQAFEPFEFTLRTARGEEVLHFTSDASGAASLDDQSLRNPTGVGNNELVETHYTGANGWEYRLAVPRSVVFGRMAYFRQTVFRYGILVTIAGLTLAFVFARATSRPFRDFLSVLQKSGMNERLSRGSFRKPFNELELSLRSLTKSNAELRTRIAGQEELISNALLHRLLNGELHDHDSGEVLKRLGIDLSATWAFVVVIRFRDEPTADPDLDKSNASRFLVYGKALLCAAVGSSGVCYQQNPDMLVAIVNEETEKPTVVDLIRNRFDRSFTGAFLLGVGTCGVSTRGIHRSYREACECVAYAGEFSGATVSIPVYYADLREKLQAYSFSPDVENRILNYVRAARPADVRATFSELRKENFVERDLGHQMLGQLLDDLTGALVKAISRFEIADGMANGRSPDPFGLRGTRGTRTELEIEMDRIEEAFVSLCGAAREARRSHNTVLAKRLEAEVRDRYDDAQLSLDSLSSALGLSPSYTSQLFKQYTGENFYTHVEHIRVEKARYLLETTALTVNEVAERVGYRTDQSFRRAFKRVTGLRPTAIRAALAARPIEESTEFHKD